MIAVVVLLSRRCDFQIRDEGREMPVAMLRDYWRVNKKQKPLAVDGRIGRRGLGIMVGRWMMRPWDSRRGPKMQQLREREIEYNSKFRRDARHREGGIKHTYKQLSSFRHPPPPLLQHSIPEDHLAQLRLGEGAGSQLADEAR